MITLTLTTRGIEYKAEAETIEDAFAGIDLSWENIKANGTVKVTDGKKKVEHLYYIKQLRRIFANKLCRVQAAKRLSFLFNDKI